MTTTMTISPTRRKMLDLAARGHRAPIGTHLVLHRHPDHAALVRDGARLGAVVAETADCFDTPLAVPLMDLTIEKECLLGALGVPEHDIEAYHFGEPPARHASFPVTAKMTAACDAIRAVSRFPDLLPMGMSIGPFSLMTKLVADPITPVFLAGTGLTATDEPEIAIVERTIEVGTELIVSYVQAQARAGARAVIVCEPAANQVYFSPHQLANSYAVFDRYVLAPMQRIRDALSALGAELVFHDCGELTPGMVSRFAGLEAAMMSLGSSRALWEDAARVPPTTVLYGNLPTKRFFSAQLTPAEVARHAADLAARMQATGHPFILGSECDVLSVPGLEADLMAKVHAFLRRG